MTSKRYTRKSLKLTWGDFGGADTHAGEVSARVGDGHFLYVRPPRHGRKTWAWMLNEADRETGRRGWNVISGDFAAATELQAQGMAEEAVESFARALLSPFEKATP